MRTQEDFLFQTARVSKNHELIQWFTKLSLPEFLSMQMSAEARIHPGLHLIYSLCPCSVPSGC